MINELDKKINEIKEIAMNMDTSNKVNSDLDCCNIIDLCKEIS